MGVTSFVTKKGQRAGEYGQMDESGYEDPSVS